MEKGLYSVSTIKKLILYQKNQVLYYVENDPYNNLVEIEFMIDDINDEGLVVILHRYYTRGEIHNVIASPIYLIPFKDYQYIRKKSQFL